MAGTRSGRVARTVARVAAAAALGACALAAAAPAAAASPPAGTGVPAAGVPAAAAAVLPAPAMVAEWGDDDTGEGAAASRGSGVWHARRDLGSLFSLTRATGAQDAWRRGGTTGAGVTVAVIDTGVAPVAGLDTPGKVVDGPDLSFDSQDPATRYLDGFGHGTHMAGIIAGRDAGVRPGREADPQRFVGVAPDARILNVKVGTADGGTDVSQVIAAIDWVVAHRRDNGMDVRVINLSYGTRSVQPYQVDPLARAVENAWAHGIVVVTAAGNDGLAAARLTMPAADPYVIAVGASDHRGTDDTRDDTVAEFTNGGDASRRPDLLAPGKSVVSLRVPGSLADRENPGGLVPGDRAQRFFRGSGTSQAAAVVSGAAALLLQARPDLTPDQVKWLLTSTAAALPRHPHPAMGAGVLDIDAALAADLPAGDGAAQRWTPSTGLGSLDASRGDARLVDPVTGAVLAGEVDALGAPWDAARWVAASAAGTAWDGGDWNARSWSGDGWTARSWSGDAWAARSWSGASWTGLDWQARSWSGDGWVARSWSGDAWVARSWSGNAWVARSWSGDNWAARSWSRAG